MGWYYYANRSVATNATPNTENAADLLFLTSTGSTQRCLISSVMVSSNVSGGGTSLAGALITFKRGSTNGGSTTTGSALSTVVKAHPLQATIVTRVRTGASTSTGTLTVQRSVGCAAPGGAGGWMAQERSEGMQLESGRGANGNLEASTFCGLASITLNYTTSFQED